MGTTLALKASRDLGRRRARAILTSATIALAVASTGMLAVPTLIDHTMSGEVRETHLYDITLPVRDMKFDDNTGREPAAIPNVDAVSARVTDSTRALVGDRRIPATLWGVDDFTRQSIDKALTRPAPSWMTCGFAPPTGLEPVTCRLLRSPLSGETTTSRKALWCGTIHESARLA
jgi:hypothetical protein